jgi:hypothetical protein
MSKPMTYGSRIHTSGVRKLQERLYKSTNFGQSQWLIGDLLAQQSCVRSDP